MPPIRKGDGTPVTPKGISQVRTGDGRILFDGIDIPDSVLNRPDDDVTADPSLDSIPFGIILEVSSSWSKFGVEISQNTGTVDAFVREIDENDEEIQILDSVESVSAGDLVAFNDLSEPLKSDKTYRLDVETDGETDVGFWDNSEWPQKSDDDEISVLQGWQSGVGRRDRFPAFSKLGNVGLD